jgi:thioredoxin 1
MGFLSKVFGPRAPRVQPVHLDDSNFVTEVPVVVDFWGPGCGPCQMLQSIVMDLASAYQGRVKVAELNAAQAGWAAARYGVMSTPTVLFFKRGGEVERVVGFVGERYLREIIDTDLLGGVPGR